MIEFASVSIGTAKKVLREIRGERVGLRQLRPTGPVGNSMYVPTGMSKADLSKIKRDSGIAGKVEPNMVIVPRQVPEERLNRVLERHLPMNSANHGELVDHSTLHDPIDSSLHEHGHVSLPKETGAILKKAGKDVRSKNGIPLTHPYFKTVVNEEYRANRDILNRIRTHGTPQEAKAWTNRAQLQIKTGYRRPIFNNAIIDEVTHADTAAIARNGHLPLSLKRRVLQKHPHLRKQELSARHRLIAFCKSL